MLGAQMLALIPLSPEAVCLGVFRGRRRGPTSPNSREDLAHLELNSDEAP